MAADSAPATDAAAFNFSRAGLVANDQLRTLRTLDEQFARNLTHTLGAWLRTTITIAPQPASQVTFSQFMEQTSAGCFVLPLRMDPMHVRAALSLDIQLAPAIIDLLLGGSGKTTRIDRELTEIEEAVLGSVLDIVLREWTSAWTAMGVEFLGERRERDSHGQRLMPLQEKVLFVRFAITLADVTGDLLFCLPSSAVTSTMKAMSHRQDRQRMRTTEERARMELRIGNAKLRMALLLPAMRLYAQDLRTLKPGVTLGLPLQSGATAELRVGNVTVYRARPVRYGEQRGAQLMQLVETLRTEAGTE
ncbi:flagellar motor switch protein FliM [Terriglobus sp. RCC_193]|uniref:flagellar motor switch protein FliM n=1 Tax=Terriglobus sp. RCC_193 TaxID=3239218 RepID=UPI00352527C9